MLIEIRRKWETPQSVCSEVWVDGQQECFGLEPARTAPFHPGHPCIPAGSYDVELTMSPHLGYVTPEVLNVPGRSAIRWHIANFPRDVLGCVAVGTRHAFNMVLESREAFENLMVLLKGAVDAGEKLTAIYTDPEEK